MTDGINTGLDSVEENIVNLKTQQQMKLRTEMGKWLPKSERSIRVGRVGQLWPSTMEQELKKEERLGIAQPKLSKVDENINPSVKRVIKPKV